MSDQIIVATFNNTNAAYDAAAAMKALKDKGITDFKAKAGVLVRKSGSGQSVGARKQGAAPVGNGDWHCGRRADRTHRRRVTPARRPSNRKPCNRESSNLLVSVLNMTEHGFPKASFA